MAVLVGWQEWKEGDIMLTTEVFAISYLTSSTLCRLPLRDLLPPAPILAFLANMPDPIPSRTV